MNSRCCHHPAAGTARIADGGSESMNWVRSTDSPTIRSSRIDYGIYLLSRICEEFTSQGHDWGKAITAALTTTGKAIMFTATIMLIGILPWYFLSDLKFGSHLGLPPENRRLPSIM